jgi:hypothetical protein
VFGDGAQLLIDLLEQRCDKLHRDHAALSSQGQDVIQISVEESSDDCKLKNMYY